MPAPPSLDRSTRREVSLAVKAALDLDVRQDSIVLLESASHWFLLV